tara:strand:+ start:150434 stop:151717 length:1284 start_codon:yes stop_codon:yes gene_type:complete
MTYNDDDRPNPNDKQDTVTIGSNNTPGDDAVPGKRNHPLFDDLEESDRYEELDRDTDYASGYRDDDTLDNDFTDELLADDYETMDEAENETDLWEAASSDDKDKHVADWDLEEDIDDIQEPLWDDEEADDFEEPAVDTGATAAASMSAAWSGTAKATETSTDPESTDRWENIDLDAQDTASDDDPDDWDDEPDEYVDLDDDNEKAQRWPLALIAVGIFALVLLSAGGYGVIQQRSAMQEEIRQLQAALATAASPAEVTASREALQEIDERNFNLQTAVDTLTLENRRLNDTVAGLERQLESQQQLVTKAPATAQPVKPKPAPPAARPAAKPAPAPTPEPTPAAPAIVATSGNWFVNFASYGERSTAQNWVAKLKPAAGKTVMTSVEKDGRTYYRVRIVDLPDRDTAERVARTLEQEYSLSKRWVGEQ